MSLPITTQNVKGERCKRRCLLVPETRIKKRIRINIQYLPLIMNRVTVRRVTERQLPYGLRSR